MRWRKHIALLLSFVACCAAQSTSTPEITTRNAHKGASSETDEELRKKFKKRRETKIVHLKDKLTMEDLDICKNPKDEIPKDCCYDPQVIVIIGSMEGCIGLFHPWFYRVKKLPINNGKCFFVRIESDGRRMTLSCGPTTEHLDWVDNGMFKAALNGWIFPQGLRKNFGVDVICPPLHMFREEEPLFRGEPKDNKKLFEKFFGWNAEDPIKLAFIFSRNTHDDKIPNYNSKINGSMSELRVRKVSDWLKSLPKGNETLVFGLPEDSYRVNEAATGDGKDVAIILFGGNNILIESFTMEYKYRLGDDKGKVEMEEKANEEQFRAWKTEIIDKWPKNAQKIAFLIEEERFYLFRNLYSDNFGSDTKLAVLPKYVEHCAGPRRTKATFVLVGFPEL